jgi:nitrate/nitrite-specific signal transduction histidine kinase
MRERAEMARGRCDVVSLPGHGTTVEVWLPTEEVQPQLAIAAGGESFR